MLAAHNVREDNSHVHCTILHLLYTIQVQSFVVQTFRDTAENRKNINVHKKNFVIVLFFCVVYYYSAHGSQLVRKKCHEKIGDILIWYTIHAHNFDDLYHTWVERSAFEW